MAFVIGVALFAGFVVGTYLSPYFKEVVVVKEAGNGAGKSVEVAIPAIDGQGNGVMARLVTTARPGSGLVLVSVNDALAQADTQFSARTAAQAAANATGTDLSSWDIIYAVKVNASVIEGPSAGAAMAVSVVAALENRTLREGVSITGTIEADGSIGSAGGIAAKAAAAHAAGTETFLVPEGLGVASSVARSKECFFVEGMEYCKVSYHARKASIAATLDLNVVEVRRLEDTFRYFFDDAEMK